MTPRDAGRVVIVGGGLAGFTAASALREQGHTGSITVVDPEPALYDRPPLSKDLVAEADLARVSFATPEALEALGVRTVLGARAAALDDRGVLLDDGTALPADTVLLATGGAARRLTVPGADHPAVHVLRTFSDAVAFGAAAQPGRRAVVVGGGLIGAEATSVLVRAGLHVTIVEPQPSPLAPAIGQLLAGLLHGMHTARGVAVTTALPERIEPVGDGVEVVLTSGERLPAHVVLVGIGTTPNDAIARAAGLEVDGGVVVDDRQRTSDPRVFAAGDVARRRGADGVLARRDEHWEAAQVTGRAAAAGMLGLDPEPRRAPWFWSDRYGIHLEAVGRLSGPGTTVVREGGAFPGVFLVDGGLLAGAASIDDAVTVRAARRLIDQRIPVSEDALRDPAVPLRSLLRAAPAGART